MATKSQERRPSAKKTTPKKQTTRRPGGAKGKPWVFPKNPLEEALRIARAIEDKNAGKPMRAPDLAKAVGFNKSNDWRFQDLLRSANQYGLVSGAGAAATVKLDQIGEGIVAPSSPSQRQESLLAAFRNVELFARVEEFYAGKKIPDDEFFENTLVREFSVDRERVATFIEVFLNNLKYLNLFNARKAKDSPPEDVSVVELPTEDATHPAPGRERVREFLDTCFVMMPFGDWFDRYYRDIYVKAVRDAGFEPVRADELFSTGSVVEQIWEQIEKATVLLADLSDKNANVFYELGLAHAAKKPVILSAASIEDVPFDLRHLRVIVYDVREPDWAIMLAKSVTDYLKNARAEPAKSIPQPFRLSATDNDTS